VCKGNNLKRIDETQGLLSFFCCGDKREKERERETERDREREVKISLGLSLPELLHVSAFDWAPSNKMSP
jgi:hypothetical protein